jgi:hypothetical protein
MVIIRRGAIASRRAGSKSSAPSLSRPKHGFLFSAARIEKRNPY